ncbi:Pro-Pol polyprotein [Hypsizygus marmoreus]|uniref:Pro-Pol polyprotein n=1 Tax=Hypsizygus marmoreus TaxID=39966 RepID=A0A369JRI3_HYPMA|nr:Pro-Pol polyprotein [Hypsizygus marmoreus]
MHARPLIQLTRKDIEFEFGQEEYEAMNRLKDLVIHSPAIRAIDYASDREVILAVDSSWIAVGFILLQLGKDNKRYPSRFGSITWNEREQRYSQAKIELYGLFRALRAVQLYIVGVRNFVVEVDAKYIKGMINNPDIQPNAAMNRWIAGILLFDFTLRHVPGKDHAPADGLSRRPAAPEDPMEDDDPDDWIDNAYGFSIALINWEHSPTIHTHACPSTEYYLPDTHSPRPSTFRISVLVSAMLPDKMEIPRSHKAVTQDEFLQRIQAFLTEPIRPPDMSELNFRRFVNYAGKFFVHADTLWRRDSHNRHKVVLHPDRRLHVLVNAHDELGHKGFFSVRTRLADRFWWPMMNDDIKWYIRTCHDCQIRSVRKLHIPPTIPHPPSLFRKVHIDTFFMPEVAGLRYVVHARCALSSWPEWRMLRSERAEILGQFIFEEILCRWGAVEEIITDNGKNYIAAVQWLADKYNIHHIRISPYNSQANGIVERRNFDVREAMIKSADGIPTKWPTTAHSVFWAERVTTQKSTGYSPYYIAHGVEPLFPFDFAEATYMAPVPDDIISTTELLTTRAIMLQMRPAELTRVRADLLKSRHAHVCQYIRDHARSFRDFNFPRGTLVLVRNSTIEASNDRKSKPRYFGPMIVVRRLPTGSYALAEIDGTLSKLRFAAFRVVPYHPRSSSHISVTTILDIPDAEIEAVTHEPPPPEYDPWEDPDEL